MLPRSWYRYLWWNPPSDHGNARLTQFAYVMYTVATTIVLAPMSQRLWTSGPQSTMLQTSRRLAHTLAKGLGKSSTTVDKTLSPNRAKLGNLGRKPSTNLLTKYNKKCHQKVVVQSTKRLSKLQPVHIGTASINNTGSHSKI